MLSRGAFEPPCERMLHLPVKRSRWGELEQVSSLAGDAVQQPRASPRIASSRAWETTSATSP
eukprot:2298378-Rhodomonas_salina.3